MGRLGGRRGPIFGPRRSHVLGGEGELARVLAATRGRWDALEPFGTLRRACADPRGSGRREWLIPCSQLSRAAPSAGGARRRRPGGSGGAGPPQPQEAAGCLVCTAGAERTARAETAPPSRRRLPTAPLIASVDGRARCLSCGGTSRSPVPLRRSRRGRCCVRARREAAQPPSRRGSAPAGCATRRPLLASRRASRRLSELLAASTAAAATTTTARSFAAAAAARWLAALFSLATCRGGSRGGVVR